MFLAAQIASLSSVLLVAATAAPSSLLLQRHEATDPSPEQLRQSIRRKLPSYPTIDFEGFQVGDIVTALGNGVTVAATKRNGDTTTQSGNAMIFDTTNPTGDDTDLGTPHVSFGGPGVGKAGKKGKLFENANAQGLVLIITEDDDASDPDDNEFGGLLVFTFVPPRYIESIGMLDNDEGVSFTIETTDGGSSTITDWNGGNNSFENVKIGKPGVTKLTVDFGGSGAITNLQFDPPSTCPSSRSILLLDSYTAGDTISDFGNGVTVQATKSDSIGNWGTGSAMVFDSSNPSGDDSDLGTPHVSFGGPGIGKAGKSGKLFENRDPQGNVLIVSEDNDASDPDDNQYPSSLVFTFASPIYIDSIGLLDNDDGTTFTIETSDGGSATIANWNGGNNSFESVKVGKPGVVKLTVDLSGSGAITDITACG